MSGGHEHGVDQREAAFAGAEHGNEPGAGGTGRMVDAAYL